MLFWLVAAIMTVLMVQGAFAEYVPFYVEAGNASSYNETGVWDYNGLYHAYLFNRTAVDQIHTLNGTAGGSSAYTFPGVFASDINVTPVGGGSGGVAYSAFVIPTDTKIGRAHV